MLGFLTFIPDLLKGLFGTINNVTSALSNERINLVNATTDRERAEITGRIEALQIQRDVLVADAAKSKLDLYLRTAAALGPIAYVDKYYLWDKVIGSLAGCVGKMDEATAKSCAIFTTDPVSTEEWILVGIVYGFLFVHSMVKS